MTTGLSGLCGDLDVDVVPDAPIGAWTWYGVGGRADLLVRPRNVAALETLVQRCRRSGTAIRVLGSGANLLVADEGVSGIVIRLDAPAFRSVRFGREGGAPRLRAMAGADLARTILDAARRGFEGLSHLAGVPATIGGAIVMNAGGRFGAIGDAVDSVTCIGRAGGVVTYPCAELSFEYRATNIPDPIVLAATFALVEDDPIAVRERVKSVFAHKKGTQPLAGRSAGCAFRNPVDPVTEERVSAGRLIDEAGLKGLRIGGASVSTHHANFVLTEPGASADDVLRLLDEIRRRVFDRCGIELEREIVVWGRDDETDDERG
jgi:UDP-N-acetylmuramate dehydrogenase